MEFNEANTLMTYSLTSCISMISNLVANVFSFFRSSSWTKFKNWNNELIMEFNINGQFLKIVYSSIIFDLVVNMYFPFFFPNESRIKSIESIRSNTVFRSLGQRSVEFNEAND